jgi:hypothetical protein
MTVAEWLALAKADAEKRGLPDLIPALEGLARATEQLRAADWNDAADRQAKEQGDADPR